jgi:uncharacterized protein YkwD
MRSLARRLSPITLAVLLVASLVPTAFAADTAEPSAPAIAGAEQTALKLTNQRRASRGLVSLRWDPRLAELARARATYMAETGVFSHTQAGGGNVFDMIEASNIKWYGAGEIIAWNTAGPLDASVAMAVQGWMTSPGHKAILVSKGYNYVGFGMAVSPSSGRRYLVGVYLEGPDRTPSTAKITGWSKVVLDRDHARVTIRWSGRDVRLQVLTAGLRYFQVQRRAAGHAWRDFGTTRSTSVTVRWSRGHTYEVRVRSRDRAGNWSAWQTRTITP